MLDITIMQWVFAAFVAFTAGFIKGVVGFAMPLIILAGLTFVFDPKIALAGLILPTVFSNLVQVMGQGLGEARSAVRDYRNYLIAVCVVLLVVAQLVPAIDRQTFFLVLGIPITAISLIQIAGVRFSISQDQRAWGDWVAGAISGTLGGIAGNWGPTTVLYLIATDTPKARQIVVQGLIYGSASVMLFGAHLVSGILSRDTIGFSASLIPPAILGILVGRKAHDLLDQNGFRKVTLIVLAVAGVNLIRKGLFG